jgi:hypothetical protein
MFVFVLVVENRGLLRHLVHDLIYIKINKMVAFSSIPCAYSWVTWNLTFPFTKPSDDEQKE